MAKTKAPLEDPLKTQLDALALSIASTVNSEGVPLQDRLDAFKALTAYQLGFTKLGKKTGKTDEPPRGETFDGYRNAVEASGD